MVTNNAINLPTGALNTVVQGQGAGTAPAFSTATYPATTTINQILYSSAANTVTGLATANKAVVNTNGSGVPSITADPTWGTQTLSEATHAMVNLQDTSAGSTTAGPVTDLYRKTTGAATNVLGQVTFTGQNASSAKKTFASITTTLDTATAAAEDSSWRLATLQAGASTNQVIALKTGCQVRGNNTNTAAPAGYMGEIISSNIAQGSPISTPINGAVTDIATINLTTGNWIIFVIAGFTGSPVGGTRIVASVNTASGTLNTIGVGRVDSPTVPTANSDSYLIIYAYPVTVQVVGSVFYYSVSASAASGTISAFGTLGAYRIG